MPVAKGSTIDPARTRATIIQAAGPLLYERGLDGLGVAELCTRLGISKETLYRHFGTKDGLVHAVLQARSDQVVTWLTEAADSAGEDPADQLTAVFDALGQWYGEPTFRGCAMVNAATQHYDDTVLSITARHLTRYLDLLTGIAARAGAADPATLGRQLLMLVEGATILAAHQGSTGVSDQARTAAIALLSTAGT
ncbi:TetR/AcrR family transcriptional regulator [Nocardia sp. NPDC005366]|uniref:TetR/AcrR family transcriptional regulator n=1 Tax=Nocardia sp. NPDC005366 TaxID=3156878 RepID=UPI0033A8ABCE